jgi:hypothetical protein
VAEEEEVLVNQKGEQNAGLGQEEELLREHS